MESLRGRCLCGAVVFEVDPPTQFLSHCHCQSCRRASGAAFVTWSSVPRDQLRVVLGLNQIRWYATSAPVRWGTCGECGSLLLYDWDVRPDRMYFTVGSIEGPLDREPEAHVSFEEHLPWVDPNDGLPRYRGKGPERID